MIYITEKHFIDFAPSRYRIFLILSIIFFVNCTSNVLEKAKNKYKLLSHRLKNRELSRKFYIKKMSRGLLDPTTLDESGKLLIFNLPELSFYECLPYVLGSYNNFVFKKKIALEYLKNQKINLPDNINNQILKFYTKYHMNSKKFIMKIFKFITWSELFVSDIFTEDIDMKSIMCYVEPLIKSGELNVSHKDKLDKTPLMIAEKCGSIQNLKMLIKHGAIPDRNESLSVFNSELNFDFYECLFYVLENYNEFILKKKIVLGYLRKYEMQVKIYLPNDINNQILRFYAKNYAKHGKFIMKIFKLITWDQLFEELKSRKKSLSKYIEPLIKSKELAVDYRDRHHDPALISAVYHGKIECARFFMKYNANLNIMNSEGMTPLWHAIIGRKIKIIELLLNNTINENLSIINVNIKRQNGQNMLHTAIILNYLDGLKILLNHEGIDLNCQDNDGRATFHYACKGGNYKIIKLFLNYNPDLNVKDRLGKTPIFYIPGLKDKSLSAPEEESLKIFKLLLIYKDINLNIQDCFKKTVLHYAVQYKREKNVKLFAKKGLDIDVNIRDDSGKTALDYAYETKDRRIIKLLLNFKK